MTSANWSSVFFNLSTVRLCTLSVFSGKKNNKLRQKQNIWRVNAEDHKIREKAAVTWVWFVRGWNNMFCKLREATWRLPPRSVGQPCRTVTTGYGQHFHAVGLKSSIIEKKMACKPATIESVNSVRDKKLLTDMQDYLDGKFKYKRSFSFFFKFRQLIL
jgi:hypothetical protein